METIGYILEKIADMFRAALRFLENLFLQKGDDALGDVDVTKLHEGDLFIPE